MEKRPAYIVLDHINGEAFGVFRSLRAAESWGEANLGSRHAPWSVKPVERVAK